MWWKVQSSRIVRYLVRILELWALLRRNFDTDLAVNSYSKKFRRLILPTASAFFPRLRQHYSLHIHSLVMSAYVQYFLDIFIVEFFTRTSVTREACDEKAAFLIENNIISVSIQESCSYIVYNETCFEFIVQFWLQSLSLNLKTTILARKIHDNLAFIIAYHEQLEDTSQETALVYSLDRISGISYLEFCLANNYVENSEENLVLQADLMMNLAWSVVLSTWRSNIADNAMTDS